MRAPSETGPSAPLSADQSDLTQRVAQLEAQIATTEDNLARTAALLEDVTKSHADAVAKARGLFNLVMWLGAAVAVLFATQIWLIFNAAT